MGKDLASFQKRAEFLTGMWRLAGPEETIREMVLGDAEIQELIGEDLIGNVTISPCIAAPVVRVETRTSAMCERIEVVLRQRVRTLFEKQPVLRVLEDSETLVYPITFSVFTQRLSDQPLALLISYVVHATELRVNKALSNERSEDGPRRKQSSKQRRKRRHGKRGL